MATIKYADGRSSIECDTVAEAVEILERECQVVEEFPDRWLAWDTEMDAENDGGARAVAEIVKENVW